MHIQTAINKATTAGEIPDTTRRALPYIKPAPKCPICNDLHFLRYATEIGDPMFGRLTACECQAPIIAARENALALGASEMGHMRATLDNFTIPARYKPEERQSLQNAFEAAQAFVEHPEGWLIFIGAYGCGKSHLAAAIGNALQGKTSILFITVPDLMDELRAGYNDDNYHERLGQVKNMPVLIIDDLAAEKGTEWTAEKLFQIINYRYNRAMPTVITTNAAMADIDGRIASRLADVRLARRVIINAPDYRKTR